MTTVAAPPHGSRSMARRGMPTGQWVAINLFRLAGYLAFASLTSAAVLGLAEAGPPGKDSVTDVLGLVGAGGLTMFLFGGIGCLPGLVVWLVVCNHARTQPARARRLALATAPLVGIAWLVSFVLDGGWAAAFAFGLLWPIGAGFVIRLDPPPTRMPV